MKRVNFILLALIVIFIAWGKSSTEQPPGKVDYLSLFPSPLKGWKASEVTVKESEREMDYDPNTLFGLLGGEKKRLILTRTYREIKKHDARVTIVIDTWDFAYELLVPRTPDAKKELEESFPDMKAFTYQSYNGIKLYENKKLVEIILSPDFCRGFKILLDKVEDENIIMKYLKKSDLQKIHAFMKQH